MIIQPMKKKKPFLAALLTLIIIFNMSSAFFSPPAKAVSQTELNTLKQQQSQLSQQKTSLQSQSDSLKTKVNSQTEKLSLLNSQLAVTNSEMDNLSKQIAIYTDSIAAMENQLNQDEQKEQDLLDKYKARVRVMEENGSIAYISILFQANSFQDLLGRIDCINSIMEYDNGLIKDVEDAKKQVLSAKSDMENEMNAQQNVFNDYKDKQQDLASQQAEAKDILNSLSASSADYAQQLTSVTSLESSINSKISTMTGQLADQKRIQAEQQAAAQAATDNNNWSSSKSGGSSKGSGSNSGSNSGSGGSTMKGSGTGQDIVNYAKQFLGVPYVYGGTSPSGFDCSGLVYYCYRHYGYAVNRTATGLSYNGKSISKSELQPGDVILFTEQYDNSEIGHTGIYIGGGQFIHAPHTGDVVKISSLSDSYYTSHYWGARRIIS